MSPSLAQQPLPPAATWAPLSWLCGPPSHAGGWQVALREQVLEELDVMLVADRHGRGPGQLTQGCWSMATTISGHHSALWDFGVQP